MSLLHTKISGTCLDHAITNYDDNLHYHDLDSLELIPKEGATVRNHALTLSQDPTAPVVIGKQYLYQ